MKRKFFVFLLTAVFCVNSMTVFAESEKIGQEGNTETGEITDTVQAEDSEIKERAAEEASAITYIRTSLKKNVPKIGGGLDRKKNSDSDKPTPSILKGKIKLSEKKLHPVKRNWM